MSKELDGLIERLEKIQIDPLSSVGVTIQDAIAALSAPPTQGAGVGDGTVIVRKSLLRHCIRELNAARRGDDSDQRADIVHVALARALAGQPKGETP